MHFRIPLTTAITVVPIAVSAAGQLGFALGSNNPDGSCKQQSDYQADFQAITNNTASKLVRTYAASGSGTDPCNIPSEILPAAKAAGVKVLLGMWPDGGSYEKEKASIVAADIGQYGDTVFGITVGSEGMYRGTYDAESLIGWIHDMKKTFPATIIGSADSWSCWSNGSMDGIIKSGLDLVYVESVETPYT